jgi:predicted enzyme related to lactoylglutathione lyase
MPQADQDRRIDYIEFGSANLDATKAFFTQVFGWKFTDYGPEYTSFEDGRMNGGFFRDDAAGGKNALVVLYATDLEQMKAAIEAAGVKVFNEHAFPGGKRFHFVEPGGNELAVWSEK